MVLVALNNSIHSKKKVKHWIIYKYLFLLNTIFELRKPSKFRFDKNKNLNVTNYKIFVGWLNASFSSVQDFNPRLQPIPFSFTTNHHFLHSHLNETKQKILSDEFPSTGMTYNYKKRFLHKSWLSDSFEETETF